MSLQYSSQMKDMLSIRSLDVASNPSLQERYATFQKTKMEADAVRETLAVQAKLGPPSAEGISFRKEVVTMSPVNILADVWSNKQ